MAGEDDPLLQQFTDPSETPSKCSVNYFTCSPLAIPPSHAKCLKDSVHMEKPSSSTSEGNNNKENINSNNVEVPKLGMGSMQMKRRKKGGGYNLRKSLAWDRAFFTDEGILDPLELTLITGMNGNTCGGPLATISEEGNSSFSTDSRCTNESEDMQASEEVLLKALPDKNCTLKGSREKAGCSVGNHDFSPHHKVTQKDISTHRTSGSKVHGCPEPLAASSLKRPANSNNMRTAKKESKLPKLPISNPGPCFSVVTKGSMTASQLKDNLIPKSTINVQKKFGLKSCVKNGQGSQSKAKMGSCSHRLQAKDPAQKTVRNLINSSSKATSSTKSRSAQADRANSGSEMIPDRFQLCSFQEGSASLAAKDLAQHSGANLNNSLPDAARSASSGPSHIQRASSGLMISGRLHPCESQERPAALAVCHQNNLHNTGAFRPNIQPARPSGLRLPSPSLRFFDQRTASESGSLQQMKIQKYATSMDSNRKFAELTPPTISATTPMKSNNIRESVCSVVPTSSGRCSATSTLSAHYGSTLLSSLPNYSGNPAGGVSDSKINPNFERKTVQRVDIKEQYECRGSELDAHEAIELEQRFLRCAENTKMEKIVMKVDEEVEVSDDKELLESHPTEQLGEGNGANIHLDANAEYSKVGVGPHQLMSQGNDEKIALIPGIEGKCVLHNKKDGLQYYTAISTSGQSIEHQEQNISTAINGGMNFMQNLARTSREQADTEKSDAPKANLESHLDASSLEPKGWVSKVFWEFQKDEFRKRGDDVTSPKCLDPGLENYNFVLHHEKVEQKYDAAKGVGEFYKILPTEDDTGCHINSPCNKMKGRISIAYGESLKDEARNRGNSGARQLKGTDTMFDTFHIPSRNMDTEQVNNDDADSVDVFPSRSPMRDAVTLTLHDNPSAEGFHINPSTSIKNKAQVEDSSTSDRSAKYIEAATLRFPSLSNSQFHSGAVSVNCVMPAESSSLVKGPCDNATEINDCFSREKSGSNYSTGNFVEVSGQTQDGVDVSLIPGQPHAEVQLGIREAAPLVDYHNRSSSSPNAEVELVSGAALVSDDAIFKTKSVLQVAQCAGTYLQNLEVEGLDIAVATSETKFKIHEETCSQKSQEMGMVTGSLSEKSLVAEESKRSCCNILEANPTIQGCSGELETSYSLFQSENQTLVGTGTVGNFSKTYVEDAQMQLLDGDILVGSCSRLTSLSHDHPIQIIDHSDRFEEQPEFSNTGINVEEDSQRSHQLLTEDILQEFVCRTVRNDIDCKDIYECDPRPSNTVAHAPPIGQEVNFHCDDDGELCPEYGNLGSTVVDSIDDNNENYTDRRLRHGTESCDLLSELESSGKGEMVGASTTCTEYSGEGSCSFPRKVGGVMLEEKPTMCGAYVDIGRVVADKDQVCMKDSLPPEEIANLEEPNNVFDRVIVVPEQSTSHGCDLQSSSASAQILPGVQGNVSDFNGDDQADLDHEDQGFDGIMPIMGTHECFTNGQCGYGLESSDEDCSECNSNFTVSQHPTTGVRTTIKTFCSDAAELCSVAVGDKILPTSTEFSIGAHGSKINTGEIETEVLQERNSRMMGEFQHQLDSGGGLKKNKDAMMLMRRSNNIKRQDNSLAVHPPNAVPFSDEWLAAIEAAGEEILTMKCGAVQHSPPEKSLPEPSPWSPVKKKGNSFGPYDCTKYTNAKPPNPQ